VDQLKTVQARITKSSPSAAWKTLVSGTSVVNKDLAFKAKDLTLKAKAKDLTSRTSSRTAFDRGVFEC